MALLPFSSSWMTLFLTFGSKNILGGKFFGAHLFHASPNSIMIVLTQFKLHLTLFSFSSGPLPLLNTYHHIDISTLNPDYLIKIMFWHCINHLLHLRICHITSQSIWPTWPALTSIDFAILWPVLAWGWPELQQPTT